MQPVHTGTFTMQSYEFPHNPQKDHGKFSLSYVLRFLSSAVFPLFPLPLSFRNTESCHQELVQVLMRHIVDSHIAYLSALPYYFLRGIASCPVIVKETADMGIPLQNVHCLRQVTCRIEHYAVRDGKSPLERKIGKIIHEPFKYKYRVIPPVSVIASDTGDVLRGYGPLKIWVTEFDATASASESDREILSAPYAVVYLHTFFRCDILRNPSFCEVLQQYGVAKR